MAHASRSICASDDAFGPIVHGCRDSYDFTLLFQQTILRFAPAVVFVLIGTLRAHTLWRKARQDRDALLGVGKLVATTTLWTTQATLLGLWCRDRRLSTWYSLLAAVASLLASTVTCLLSYLEQRKSAQPSSYLLAYLAISVGTDTILARTLWTADAPAALIGLATASVAVRLATLALETIESPPPTATHGSRECPEAVSSILNRGVFFWLNALLRSGYKTVLTSDEIYELVEDLRPRALAPAFAATWTRTNAAGRRHALAVTLLYTFRWPILKTMAPRLMLLTLAISSPLLLNDLLLHLANPSPRPAWAFIVAFAIIYFGMALCRGYYWRNQYRVLSSLRVCLISAITAKTARLDHHNIGESETVITLITTEVDRIVNGLRWMHEYWANVVMFGTVAYLLKSHTSSIWVFLAPTAVVLLSAALSALNGKASNARQGEWIATIKERVGVTTHMLNRMRGIRLCGLSDLTRDRVHASRVTELRAARSFRFMLMWAVALGWLPELLGSALAFLALALQSRAENRPLDATVAFTTLALLNVMLQPLTLSLQELPGTIAVGGCLHRIQEFLELDEHIDPRSLGGMKASLSVLQSAKDSRVANDYAMTSLQRPSSVTLLHARNCNIGYKGGAIVIRNATLDINAAAMVIIAGPVGSGKTTLCRALVGECFVSGQMEWAVAAQDFAYCEQVTFLANASVRDNIVGCGNFDHYWYQTVVTACALDHDFATLPNGDRAVVGSGATSVSGGQKQRIALARALYARKRVIVLDDILSGLDARSEAHIMEHALGPRGLAKSYGAAVILATHATRWLARADHIVILDDGAIRAQGSYLDVCTELGQLHLANTAQADGPASEDAAQGIPPTAVNASAETQPTATDASAQLRRTGDLAVYGFYARAVGYRLVLCLTISCAMAAIMWAVAAYWLEIWTSPTRARFHVDGQLFYWAVYSSLQISGLLMVVSTVWFAFILFVERAGITLHRHLLDAVLNAPWSVLSVIDIGSVINRFSQDIELLDTALPSAMLNFQLVSFIGLAQTTLIVVASPWIGLAVPALLAILFVTQKFYLRTSRQFRLLDLEARGPLLTHALELVQGLSTYRAFYWLPQCQAQAQLLLEKSQEPRYLLEMIQLWLGFVLDTVIACVAVAIVAIALSLKGHSGPTGLALTQIMTLSGYVKAAVIYWTSLETSIGAVNRIRDFVNSTPSEHRPAESLVPPSHWPQTRRICVGGLTASYSGKSSFILALLHLLEFERGRIEIDGIDIATVPREHLRKSITVIPQDPVILPGSVRDTLDPYSAHSDAALLRALQHVQLWDTVAASGGLNAELDAKMLSTGQRQLLCLATALLSSSKVIILDETTSNIDAATDRLIQRMIREEFADRTLLVVTHRVATIHDFDMILVMEDGRLAAAGAHADLLEQCAAYRRMNE